MKITIDIEQMPTGPTTVLSAPVLQTSVQAAIEPEAQGAALDAGAGVALGAEALMTGAPEEKSSASARPPGLNGNEGGLSAGAAKG